VRDRLFIFENSVNPIDCHNRNFKILLAFLAKEISLLKIEKIWAIT
jgi:hypothetical protein